MKRIDNIFDDMCSMENLHRAYLNARKGKTRSRGVLLFEKDIEGNLKKLQNDLLSLNFKTSTYETFSINEYGKERQISRLPFFPDRIEHHLIMLQLESVWCKIFIRDTYACIKKRGIHDGLRRVKKSLSNIEGTKYCLKIDVRKFYPSINHEILKDIIRKKIKDDMVAARFCELGIHVEADNLPGQKIAITEIIDREILVKAFRISESKFKTKKDCLMIQFELEGETKVVFTGSNLLKKQIEQVPAESFPFTATVKNIDKSYQFQ